MIQKRLSTNIESISALVWVLSVAGFLAVIAWSTQLMTYDPAFGAGEAEHYLLIPMLSFAGLGLISFGIAVLSSIVSRFAHGEPHKPFLPPKISYTLGAFLIFGAMTFGLGYRQANIRPIMFTGYDSFNAINSYRVTNGLQPLTLDPIICDNLVQRWIDVKGSDTAGHNGSVEWAHKEGLDTKYSMAEVYMKNVKTTEDAIQWWDSSPGHKTAILGGYTVGCAYAGDGTIVAVLGKPL